MSSIITLLKSDLRILGAIGSKCKRIESLSKVLSSQSRKIINYFSLGVLSHCFPGDFAINQDAFTQSLNKYIKSSCIGVTMTPRFAGLKTINISS